MNRPRDDNLRLIGTEEEAAHIRDGFLMARDMLLFFGLTAVVAAGALAYVAYAEEPTVFWQVAKFVAGTATATSFVFAVFHGVRLVKYRLYRRRHERFLARYDRL